MSGIVCATRGGEGSRSVQIEAIRRSKSEKKPLTFLYVTDPTTLGEASESMLHALQSELDWMGNTLLRIAQQRAGHAGLEAQVVIRHGDVRTEIGQFLSESQADLLLLGAPRGTTANVFGDDAVEQFALSIQEITEVPVEVIRPEAVSNA